MTERYKIKAWEVVREFTYFNKEELIGEHIARKGTKYYEFSDRQGVAISELGFEGHHRIPISKIDSLVSEGYLKILENKVNEPKIIRGDN